MQTKATTKKTAKYVVRDARSREDFRYASAGAARAKFEQLTSNGRHAFVSPPLPAKDV